MKRIFASAMIVGSLASHAMAIDCTKARKPSEVTICTDPTVRTCDLDLQSAYERLRDRITSAERRLVQIAQQQWVNRRNAACGADASCLRRYCEDRTAVLDKSGWEHVTPAPAVAPVAVAVDPVATSFSGGVAKCRGIVKGYDMFFDAYVLEDGSDRVSMLGTEQGRYLFGKCMNANGYPIAPTH